jgi:hypothetical protein
MFSFEGGIVEIGEANSRPIKWAVVALARPGKLPEIKTRNRMILEKLSPYASKHDITIIFFSEKPFPALALENWRETFKGVAKVELINTASRGFMAGPEKFGYKYMCKFFSIDLYDYLNYGQYDYYMRIDTDCYLKNVNYDILAWAEANKVGYGFAMRKLEAHRPTIETIVPWVKKYSKKCEIESLTAEMDHKDLSVCFNFYNNWHIGKVSFFLRDDVQHFLKSVNSSGGIIQVAFDNFYYFYYFQYFEYFNMFLSTFNCFSSRNVIKFFSVLELFQYYIRIGGVIQRFKHMQ